MSPRCDSDDFDGFSSDDENDVSPEKIRDDTEYTVTTEVKRNTSARKSKMEAQLRKSMRGLIEKSLRKS
jgi:hypothetical protein